MFTAYKFRLRPNKTQERELLSVLETHRHVYNAALAERIDFYKAMKDTGEKKKTLTLADQYPTFAELRNFQIEDLKRGGEGPHWLTRISSVSLRDTIKRLDKAFQNFFRRVKEKAAKVGFPRFRGRDHFDSIPWDNYNNGCNLADNRNRLVKGDMPDTIDRNAYRLRVFGVGSIRVILHRPIKGKIKTVAIKREADHWYVVFTCDLGEVKIEPSTNPSIGVDVGLEHFATTSDGEHIANPRFLKKELPELRRKQRELSRKQKGGKNRLKAKKRVMRLHRKVRNARKHHHYAVAHSLTSRYGLICVENLNVRGMLKNDKLARSIGDAGWSGFISVLHHKAVKAGVQCVEVPAAGTSQECSGCGETVKKTLSVRIHKCPHCGLKLQRDVNAARVILGRGVGKLVRAEPAGQNVGHQVKRVPRRSTPPQNPLQSRDPIEKVVMKPVRKSTRSRKASQTPSLFDFTDGAGAMSSGGE